MACSKFLSFAEVVQGRDANVRVTDDGLLYAVDLVMVVTGASRDDAGKALRRLSDKLFSSDKMSERNTGGIGNARTKLVSFKHAIELVMVLPGNVAKDIRSRFAAIIEKHIAVQHDPVSGTTTVELRAEPVARAQASPEMDVIARKRQMEREDALFEIEMAERKQRLMQLTAEAQAKVVDVQKTLMETYKALCPNMLIDDRARLVFKDNLLNIASQSAPASSQLAIGNGSATGSKPLTISALALSLGHRFDDGQLQKIGKQMAAAYRAKYGNNPGKHEQFVKGAVIPVNSYTERDRGMLEAVIGQFVGGHK